MKNWFLYAIASLVLVFLFLYSWYLPANHATSLILDLRTDTKRPGIVLSDTVRIEQSFILEKNSNQIVIPLQLQQSTGNGVIHIDVRSADSNELVATNQAEIKNNQNGNILFDLNRNVLLANTAYIAQLSFSGLQENDNVRLPYAFGKYANLSGLVTQYRLKDTIWKQTDTRHGNIAMQFYFAPQESNLVLALKTFAFPSILIFILFIVIRICLV